MVYPPVLWAIELSEVLSNTKIIAEAWDAAGLYQVGYFPGYRWAQWNGHFRDDIRKFVRGDTGIVGQVAQRIAGSADIYEVNGQLPINSINFITVHDGFTMNDLVSYDGKHNEANGENSRDGINENLSWNCGYEGPTDNPDTENLRKKQIKNFASLLMISRGVPMILSGDEIRRTQQGNNNAYCQDNEISWLDWSMTDKNAEILRFFKQMIKFRKRNFTLHSKSFFKGELNSEGIPDVTFYGCKVFHPGWDDPTSKVLSATFGAKSNDTDIHMMANMTGDNLQFQMPKIAGKKWFRFVDTSLPSPEDIAEFGQEIEIEGEEYLVNNHSVVIMISK
jgi:glycogen operon protein